VLSTRVALEDRLAELTLERKKNEKVAASNP
jgi:hypothetical protein